MGLQDDEEKNFKNKLKQVLDMADRFDDNN